MGRVILYSENTPVVLALSSSVPGVNTGEHVVFRG